MKSDQYYASHVAANVGEKNKRWITVYEGKPSTDWDRSEESAIDVPVIAHETGQRCMYPNFEEMKKYTGVLEPRNFNVYQDRLAKNGMLHQAGEFFRATGAHTVLQYKEVNEALLRTSTSGGFQLLGLSDFPGQGSAFVGILDAFWESKGLVTPEKYRESCAPIVLLARFQKRAYTNAETFTAKMGIYHFGPEAIRKGLLTWQLESESGEIAASGKQFGLVVDPVKDIEKRPAMQQLLTSVRNYVASDRFAPTVTLQLYELDALFDYNKIRETETRSDEAVKQLLNQ